MNSPGTSMILYRPVGLKELDLIYDSGMKAFPARLSQQPIFYPVLDLEYARQTASDWNAKNGQFAGYVTQFKVEEEYVSRFETHTVGGTHYEEFWIPAEEMDEFNRHIIGHIKVLDAYFGDGFQGFVPDKFGLQGKNAVEQFTQLANSFVYSRMDFYLEIKRNHKAVFINYPFWQRHEFKNPGLKGKVLQAIKEAWLTSFPQTPLPAPSAETVPPVKQADGQPEMTAIDEQAVPVDRTVSHVPVDSPRQETTSGARIESPLPDESAHEKASPPGQPAPRSLTRPVRQELRPVKQPGSHFLQGVKLGLAEKYPEAVEELSRAVEEDPLHVAARTSLGVACHRLGEDDRALACYEAALRIDPAYAEACYFRANILYSRGHVREAIAGYTTAIGLEPGLIEADQKALPQDRLTDYIDAPAGMYWIAKPARRILELDKNIEANPRQAAMLKERAAEYYRLSNYEQAIADYDASLAIQPDDAGALHFRGLAHEQIGQLDQAMEDYQQAISLNPHLSNVYINRGVTYGKTGNFRQSIASLTEGIRLAPRNPDGYFNRGTSYFQLGEFENAIADFSQVIQLAANDEDAYYWRGIAHEQAGHQQEAIADYRRFLAISQNPQAREEVEQKLRQWNVEKRDSARGRRAAPGKGQKTNPVEAQKPDQGPDLYDLIAALGERALDSTWLGSGVDCYGEKAEALLSFTEQDLPIEGRELLHLAEGIRQTIKGDFQAFDPEATSPWIFIRAWDGEGFYIETNDPKSRQRLKDHFQSIEDVEGAAPPYESLFIAV